LNPLASIAKGLLLGIGAAAPIGPVNVEIARRTLGRSFADGAFLGLGAVTVDCAYFFIASLGLGAFSLPSAVRITMTVAGIALLAFLGAMSLRDGLRALKRSAQPDLTAAACPTSVNSVAACYATGLLMTLVNPMTLAFWFTTAVALGRQATTSPNHDLPMICLGVFAGTAGWVTLFAGSLALAGRRQRWWWIPVADLTGGIILVFFAIWTAWRSSLG
jgi:L-lysine exporter family protein LysE/ArgO